MVHYSNIDNVHKSNGYAPLLLFKSIGTPLEWSLPPIRVEAWYSLQECLINASQNLLMLIQGKRHDVYALTLNNQVEVMQHKDSPNCKGHLHTTVHNFWEVLYVLENTKITQFW